ncbi:MAG: bifunctional riboflavin kinase/FAD synthetase [Candidatus Sumerlaeaceae bacterium]|nr:bifunctional riboflavin kinase/FAD synthetase [Candidatus Sumerlaeaceae bacterium]
MRIFATFDEAARSGGFASGTAVTIGVFDGLHRGHRALISHTVALARRNNLSPVVITFDDHPLSVLAPPYAPKKLIYPDRKARIVRSLGVATMISVRFSREFAEQPAAAFVEEALAGVCRARLVICGYDFNFGKGGEGNADLLRALGPRLGFETEVVHAVTEDGMFVKSTMVRDLLFAGRAEEACRLLERPYELRGTVVTGFGRGSRIGFATANLKTDTTHVTPARGVYLCMARVPARQVTRAAMVNIGYNPTFGLNELSVEAHLLEFEGQLVGETVELHFLRRLRDEQKFPSVEALVAQLHRDRTAARDALNSPELAAAIEAVLTLDNPEA